MDIQTQSPRGSRARTPDLDWSQVRETVLMLELAAGQIEAAMKEGNSSVEVLTDSFTSMAGYVGAMLDGLNALPEEGAPGETKHELLANAGQVSGMVHRSIVAFQFYDKLVQRLAHVCHSLSALSGLVTDQARLFNPTEWVALQEKIRARYTTHEEVEMFEAVLSGVPVQQVLERYITDMKGKGNDVELF